MLPGTYRIDNVLATQPGHDALLFDNTHGDTNYQLVVSSDGTRATETFQRNGVTYQTVYDLGPGTDAPMRSDTNIAGETLGP